MIKLFVALGWFGVAYGAADPSVRITAFHYAGSNTRAAELCGQLSNFVTGLAGVKVVVDGNSSSPTNYFTLVGKDGDFCMTIVTYHGVADAYPWTPGGSDDLFAPTRAMISHSKTWTCSARAPFKEIHGDHYAYGVADETEDSVRSRALGACHVYHSTCSIYLCY